MKQALIAVLVCSAGAGLAFALLGAHPPTDAVAPGQDGTTTSSIRLDKTGRILRSTTSGTAALISVRAEPVDLSSHGTRLEGSGVVPAPYVPPEASAEFLEAMKALAGRNAKAAIAIRDTMPEGSTERLALTWAIAVSGQRGVPSSMLMEARELLVDWPAIEDIEKNLEEALLREDAAPRTVLANFADRMPKTVEGAVILARAAVAAGDEARAARILRTFWHEKVLEPADESLVIAEFGKLFTSADHRRRMALLLYREKFDQAKRFAELGKAEALHEAFVAVAKKAKTARKTLEAVDHALRQDPLYLYASAKRHRQEREYDDAAALLKTAAREPDKLVDGDAWWVEARIVSRGLLDAGKAKEAYELATLPFAESPDERMEAEFHAGWFAHSALGDMKRAEKHFRRLLEISPKAHDQARGHYWLGRTLEKLQREEAKASFRRAADYPTTFYGQLAAARLGVAATPAGRYLDTPDLHDTIRRRPEVEAIQLYEQAGEAGRARRLYLALARKLESPSELQALAEIARERHGPSLALAIGKSAQRQGHDPGLAAFPLGAIPDTADLSGAGKALAYAIARQESAFNPNAVSPANAKGLLQLLPSTAKKVATRHQLAYVEEKLTTDPAFNATLGSHYLDEQLSRFDGSYVLTFAAYNAGPGRINQWIKRYGDPRGKPVEDVVDWIEKIPFKETREYVQRVMENYQVYKSLLGQKADIQKDLVAGR